MNVRIVPRGHPERTLLYGGVTGIESDGDTLVLLVRTPRHDKAVGVAMPLRDVAGILLDEDAGDLW